MSRAPVITRLLVLAITSVLATPCANESQHARSPGDARDSAVEGFFPKTYAEGDRIVMPVTFVDGSTAELVFPETLELQDMRAQIFTAGGLGGVDRTIDFIYGDASPFKHDGPLAIYDGYDGRPVEVWRPAPGTYECPNLVYRFGGWFVGVRTCQGQLSERQKAEWARNLIGRQTDEGFLVLDASAPLALQRTGGHEGPELLLTSSEMLLIQFKPGRCGREDIPAEEEIRAMDDGTEVSFSRLHDGGSGTPNDWFVTWCEDGLMKIQVSYATKGFAEAAAEGLRARNIRLAAATR